MKIRTFTGRLVNPLRLRPEDIDIRDIAHALSLTCRWGGHCRKHYSVAEHSVYVSWYLPHELKLYGLLHDSTEAYLCDIPRPVKHSFWFWPYRWIERRAWKVIASTFGLPIKEPARVKAADTRVMFTEQAALMNRPNAPQEGSLYKSLKIWGLSPEEAEEVFLETFRSLTEAVACQP